MIYHIFFIQYLSVPRPDNEQWFLTACPVMYGSEVLILVIPGSSNHPGHLPLQGVFQGAYVVRIQMDQGIVTGEACSCEDYER